MCTIFIVVMFKGYLLTFSMFYEHRFNFFSGSTIAIEKFREELWKYLCGCNHGKHNMK